MIDPQESQQNQESQEANTGLRIVSGAAGVLVFLVSILFTLGSSLGAPIGFFVASRRARRRGQPVTRLASWLSAMFGSIILLLVGVTLLFSLLPATAWEEMQKGAAEAQAAQDTVPDSSWARKTFPRTAQSDSLANRFATNPKVFFVAFGIGVAITCVAFGAIGGSMGWVATVLLRYAIWGVRT